MRPSSELRALGPSLRGLFFDVDDTVTHEGRLVPAAFVALARAAAAGLRLVAVTGRPAGWAEVLACTWPLDGAIAENGAFAVRAPTNTRPRPPLERLTWDDPATGEVNQRRLAALRHELRSARLAEDQWLRRCDLAFDIGEGQLLPAADVEALAARIGAAGARTVRSSVHLHASFGDHDKAGMCVRVARAWWDEDLLATRDRYLFVGDSPNDQSCFAFFPHSAGVANVRRWLPLLAPPPLYVAEGEGGHGFAQIVDSLLAARGPAGAAPPPVSSRSPSRSE